MLALLAEGKTHARGPESLLPRAFGHGSVDYEDYGKFRRLTGKRDVPPELLPLVVLISDPGDPKSVKVIDPLNKDSERSGGVLLNGVSLEIVDQGIWPLTSVGLTGTRRSASELLAKFPWLSDTRQKQIFWGVMAAQGYQMTRTSVERSFGGPDADRFARTSK